MKNTLLRPSIFILSICLLSSCEVYLTPAILGHNIAYQPKPMVADSLKTSNYVSVSFAAGSSPNSYSLGLSSDDRVNINMGMLNYSRGHVYKNLNLSYGGFINYGEAHSQSNNKDFAAFNKSFFNVGLRTSIGYHITSNNGNTDFRLINWENAISKESGDYADYRKNGYHNHINNPDDLTKMYFSKQTDVWTTGLSSEIIWRSVRKKDTHHAFRLFLGGSPNVESNLNKKGAIFSDAYLGFKTNFSVSYYLQLKQFYMIYENGVDYNMAAKITFGHRF